jgi:hypothetical protein
MKLMIAWSAKVGSEILLSMMTEQNQFPEPNAMPHLHAPALNKSNGHAFH